MDAQMIIRLDPELKDRMQQLARAEGKSASQVVRELIEGYTRDRDMGGYISDLWERIGKKMELQGTGPGDIDRVIEEVRARNR
jgi:predicted DNA-binding protein